MQRLRMLIYSSLTLAWGVFALWQYRDYQQQHRLVEQSLHQQSDSIMTAMVGGLRSHRRLGRFFEDQLQGMLDELVKAGDVVYAAINTPQGQMLLEAGDRSLAHAPAGVNKPIYYREEKPFQLAPPAAPAAGGGGAGGGGGRGLGPGGGLGGGRGRGASARRWEAPPAEDPGEFGAGGAFVVSLVLDRRRADELAERIAWSHLLAVLAAALVAVSTGLVWRATMNLTEAKGRTRVVEAEARHLRELSQAAAGLAHETRNPLGLIRGWTQRLAESTMDQQQRREHAGAMVEECDRVTARINQFLAFARPREPDIQPLEIAQLLDELSAIMQPDLEARGLTMRATVAAGAERLEADHELLRQAVFNLLQNAVLFSPDQGTIDVTVSLPGQRSRQFAGSGSRARRGAGRDRVAVHTVLYDPRGWDRSGTGHCPSHRHAARLADPLSGARGRRSQFRNE